MADLLGRVLSNDIDGLRSGLAQDADPNERDREGQTVLINAAIDGKLEIGKLLIDNGADVNARDDLGYSALHYAAQNYLPEMATLLIAQGATVEAEDLHGNTPLGRAVFESRGRGQLTSILLKAGADKDHPNKYGQTPLGLARLIANYDVLKFFTERGD